MGFAARSCRMCAGPAAKHPKPSGRESLKPGVDCGRAFLRKPTGPRIGHLNSIETASGGLPTLILPIAPLCLMLAQLGNRKTAISDIFISYASLDRSTVRWLAEALEV